MVRYFYFLVSLLCFFVLASCAPFGRRPSSVPGGKWLELEARRVASAMTVTEKASQVLMACVDGNESFTGAMRDHFRGQVPGAVLLFGYNIARSPGQVRAFIDSCDSGFERLGGCASVMFAIDHEGGDVVRTRGVTSPLPSARAVADSLSEDAAERLYALSGAQLAELGIDLNLAPVAETLDEANEAFLGTRAYSGDSRRVVEYASAAIRGYRSAGVMTAIKHFPGNGTVDPHVSLPRLDASTRELYRKYAAPFDALLKDNPDAILVSHIIVPAIEDKPFCLSRSGVTGIIRKKMAFDGVVITDDVAMAALGKNGYEGPEAAVLALEAGCDLVMVSSGNLRPIVRAIASRAESDPRFAARLDEAVARILRMKAAHGLVKTARERYSYSRYGHETSVKENAAFDAARFFGAKDGAQTLLGDMNGK